MKGQAVEDFSFRQAILSPKPGDSRAQLSATASQEKRFRFYGLAVERPCDPSVGLEPKIDREKTRLLDLRQEGQTLGLSGLQLPPRPRSARARQTLLKHAALQEIAGARPRAAEADDREQSKPPSLPDLIGRLNRHLKGWANYYRPGYSRCAFRHVNRCVRERLLRHLHRRSQRAWRPAEGISTFSQLEMMGLTCLGMLRPTPPCERWTREIRPSGLTRGKELGGHWPCASLNPWLPSLLHCLP